MINLYDEVRNGFYITSAIKQAWASQLKVLFEIEKICTKYNIDYFADWGTLLSAIRHGGYIPWDDDLDICMKREDYIKFRQVADVELPKEFAIHDYKRQKDHWLFISKVVNCNHISFEKEHLDNYDNFPYIACVDIFVLDYLYDDEVKEQERCEEIKYLLAVADGIIEGKYADEKKNLLIADIERKYHIKISNRVDRGSGVRDENATEYNINNLGDDNRFIGIQLYELIEKQMARVSETESKQIGQMFPWVLKSYKGFPKEYYEKSVKVPYEGDYIRVPVGYEALLWAKYGDFYQIVKGSSAHGYPFYEAQKTDLYNEFGKESFVFNEFSFNPSMLKHNSFVKSEESYKELTGEYINQIEKAQADMDLPLCQQLAIDLGEMIDRVEGEGSNIVSALEEYCKSIYFLYEQLNLDNASEEKVKQLTNELTKSFNVVVSVAKADIIDRDVVIFLTVGKDSFLGMKTLYDKAVANGAKVYVTLLPLYKKDFIGNIALCGEVNPIDQNAVRGNVSGVMLTKITPEFLSFIHPEIIYTNYCYDGYNPCLSIHPEFYSENLIKHTEKLVFVQPWEFDDFDESDECDMYNLEKYAISPGIVYADEIMLDSYSLKEKYIEKLVTFAGEESRPIWDEKIFVSKLFNDKIENTKSGKKKLLYCIGINLMAQEADIVEKVREKLEIFAKNNDKVSIDVAMFPNDLCQWKKIDAQKCEKILAMIEEYSEKNICRMNKNSCNNVDVTEYDAYYGSASPLVLNFHEKLKPVMIGG